MNVGYRKNARRFTLAAALAALPSAARADRYWNHLTLEPGKWNDTFNWAATQGGAGGASLPGASDNVFITHNDLNSRTASLNVSANVASLRISNTAAGNHTNTVTQTGAFNLTTTGTQEIGNGFNGKGVYTQSNGTNTAGGTLTLAFGTGSKGTYNLSGSGALTALGDETVGVSGTGTFTQSGGTNTIGSTTTNRNLNIASSAGSGTYALSAGTLTVNGNAYVGGGASAAGGTGALNITGGTMNTTGTLKAWQNGSVLVQAGTLNAGAIDLLGGQLTLGPNVTVASPLSLPAGTLYGDMNSRYTGTITASFATLDSGLSASNELRIGGMDNQYTGGVGAFTRIQGAGTVSLPFSNDYAGDWSITGGTLSIGHASSLGINPSPLYIRSAALQINNVGLSREISLGTGGILRGTGTAAIGGRIVVGDSNYSTVTFATGTSVTDVLTIGNHLVHEGEPRIVISGNGTVRLPSSNSNFRANWGVTSGTLRIENSTALGYGLVTVGTGGTFELGGTAILLPLTLKTGATLRGTGSAASNEGATIEYDAAVTLATGTSASDTLTLHGAFGGPALTGGFASSRITVSGSGKVVLDTSSDYTGNWTLASGTLEIGANDRLGEVDNTVTFNGGTLLTSAAVTSPRTLTVAAGGGTINTNGVNSAFSGPIAGPGKLTKNGAGTLALTGTHTYTGGTTVNAGTLQVKSLHANNAVTINGGTVKVLESSPTLPSHPSGNNAFVSRPSSLSIADDGVVLGSRQYFGTLDLSNNDLILDYSGASPVADIEDMVRSGYNVTGDWAGAGITSSVAALDGNYIVAVADNAALAAPFGTAQGGPLFSGQEVDLTTVLVKVTHRADVDLDGVITPNDAAIFGGNYSENDAAVWTTGDMDYDGIYTPNDAAIFGGFYDESLASLPEPGSLGALGLAALALAGRRSRRGVVG